ncbi:Cobalt-precorrin-5B C(1)-methyltransferase [Azospirillaceae bacterium]
MDEPNSDRPLRKGWTTGACATAAVKAACSVLLTGRQLETVSLVLPKGETPLFSVTSHDAGDGWARAGVVKDAGDDPDVTHGAMIVATVRRLSEKPGLWFRAGAGVGTVTKPGLPLAVGEPAINPVPRRMITDVVEEALKGINKDDAFQTGLGLEIEISVPNGEKIAERTWNPRLGILGGISILGTTGVVVPYSCSAWIHAIQRGIDVARACGLTHVAGCTGNVSEKAVRRLYGLSEDAIIDMGDFTGGMLKYLRHHPIPRVTIAGGFAKLSKLAAGHLDLHSKRSQVDFAFLAQKLRDLGAEDGVVQRAAVANTALEVLELAVAVGLPLGTVIASDARIIVQRALGESPIHVDVLVFDRKGGLVGSSAGSEPFLMSALSPIESSPA